VKKFINESEIIFLGHPKCKNFKDLTGQKFSRLAVIRFAGQTHNKKSLWYCKCDCGNVSIFSSSGLKSGKTTSCGCFKIDKAKKCNVTHGHKSDGKSSKTYKTWQSMSSRCQNPNDSNFENYGGRGITVCERWKKFSNFLEDMGERPEGNTIDRIENNLGYYKDNCRWATDVEQANNRRNNIYLTYGGKTQTISQWERELGMNPVTLRSRLKIGWSIERAITTPMRQKRISI